MAIRGTRRKRLGVRAVPAVIEAWTRLRCNAMAIDQDLVDRHAFAGAYNSVKRFVRQVRQREAEQFDRLPRESICRGRRQSTDEPT